MNIEEMKESMEALAKERDVELRKLAEAFVMALESAYKSLPGAYEHARAEIDLQTWRFAIFVQDSDEEGNPTGEEFDDTPDDEEFGRIAAKTFRNVMSAQVRQAENERKYNEYAGREGDIVSGIVQQNDSRYTLLNLGGAEALLPKSEQVSAEHLRTNTRVKAYLVDVRRSDKGPQIVVSRSHPGLIGRLFELEVPEVMDGTVQIVACTRDPGHRTKIAVTSQDENVDAVGACVGARGSRVRGIVSELRGEKIDIVPFSEDAGEYVKRALSPAKVKQVDIDEENNTAEVVVHDFQLSLAIGKEGQNARLAARLTGYRIEIKSETQVAQEQGLGLEDADGVVDGATDGEVVADAAPAADDTPADVPADAPDPAAESAPEPAAESAPEPADPDPSPTDEKPE